MNRNNSALRIVAGLAGGKRLEAPAGLDTRPTLERVREAVFGSLQFSLPGARVLDLFAGSGAMGIEALSRGAERADFCDMDPKAAACVRRNLDLTGFADKSRVYQSDFRALPLGREGYDFIFLDPPYQGGLYEEALLFIKERGLLALDGCIVAEHDGTQSFPGWEETKRKKYGKAYISFLKRNSI